MSSVPSVGATSGSQLEVALVKEISANIQSSNIRMGTRSYFVEKWTESYDILTTAVKTKNIGQFFFALGRMVFQAAMTPLLMVISVYQWVYSDRTATIFNQSTEGYARADAQELPGISYGFVLRCKEESVTKEIKEQMKELQDHIKTKMVPNYFGNTTFSSFEDLKTHVGDMYNMFFMFCCGGYYSLNIAIVAKVNDQKVVITVDSGNSTLWLERKGQVQKLTKEKDDSFKTESWKKGNEIRMSAERKYSLQVFEVQEGDRIVGTTDFIDHLDEGQDEAIVKDPGKAFKGDLLNRGVFALTV